MSDLFSNKYLMTSIDFKDSKFKRYTSLDIITEIWSITYTDFVEDFDKIAPDKVKCVFDIIENSIWFEKFESIFLEYIKNNLNFTIIDTYQLHYLFHYEIDEVFENADSIVSNFTPDIWYTLYYWHNLIDVILDMIKYHIIWNKLDKTGKYPLYSSIPNWLNSLDIEYIKANVKYKETIRKLPVSKFKWLFFLLLMTKHGLFMYRDEFSKKFIHQITNQHIIQDQIYVDAYVINIWMLFEKILLSNSYFPDELFIQIKEIIDENFSLWVEYSKRFNDMFASREVAEEFMNAQIIWKIKNWKPYFFEVWTKTKDTDFKKRKEKLWFNRKIEENTEWGKVNSLTVKKKYKYWKKDNKWYSFFAIPWTKEGI